MQSDLILICTGRETHTRQEVGKFDYIDPSGIWDPSTADDPQNLTLQESRNRGRQVKSQRIERVELPEGTFYRILCTSCRGLHRQPWLVSEIEIHRKWKESDTPGALVLDVSI